MDAGSDADSVYPCVCVTRFPGLAAPREHHRAWHGAVANNSLQEPWASGPAPRPPCRSAYSQCRHLSQAAGGGGGWPEVSRSSTPRETAAPSTAAPTPPGLPSNVCLLPIIEQNTQEIKQGPTPRPHVTPYLHCACKGAEPVGQGQEEAAFSSPDVSPHHKNHSLG